MGVLDRVKKHLRHTTKRTFDVAVSAGALATLSPVILSVAAVSRFQLGDPVLFRQERPGLDGEIFLLTKFRTMREAFDADGNPLADAERMTTWGNFLRRTSLDELPTLWNVLKGDMSLVGPRPLLVEYLPLYSEEQARRHNVKPGITGWAQVHGRNLLEWEEKFRLDLWYVEHQSLGLDLRILWKTVAKVLEQEGISQKNQATMERFRGTPKT